jgi:hypothetical protein
MKMRKIGLRIFLGLFVISSNLYGQDQNLDLVKVQVIASGKTESEAITEALRSALTQTSSVFISSNTTLINDELEKDQISMINNGSVAEYKIIDKATKDDGTIFLTCNVIVSVNKLGSFVESSGGATELKGGLFASNIKLMELNERAEEKSIQDLLNISREMLNSAFDYEIINGEPKNKNGKWQIPLIIQIKKNLNYIVFTNFFYSTLKNIKLPDNEVESYIRLNKPVYSIGLFDNSKITSSTPILNTERVLPKQTNFQYYTKLYDDYDQYGELKRYGGLMRYENYNDFTQFLKERAKLLKKVNYQPTSLKAPYGISGDIFTSTQETIYDNIVLRSKKSYDSLSNFVLGFSKFIQNAEINNGLNIINLSEIGYYSNDYRREYTRNDYLLGAEKNIYLPISFYNFQGHWVKFLSDFRNSECNTLGMPNLEKFGSQHQLQYSMDYGKNSTWEDKMLVMQRTSNGEYEWVSYKQYNLNTNNNSSFKTDATYPYFDFVFASYAKYLNDFQILKSKSSKLKGFPLQLTLVGNHQNVVFKIEVNNIVTLDEISNIQKYTIRKIK